jgi:Cu(I)/Ag(I) efflux system membrane fusion protein
MSLVRSAWVFGLLAAIVVGWTGCSGSSSQKGSKTAPPEGKPAAKTPGGPAPSEPAKPHEHEGHEGSGAAKSGSPTGLAELSAEDRALAEKQRICPVSGDLLGSMGKPYKVTVKGRTVFLCCDGCEPDIKKDPDKFLAKLGPAGAK